jgi:SAM-dependent methyltransferase
MEQASARPIRSVLELGSGGGNNASHLAKHFSMTLVDSSPGMLAVSRALNPGCEHVEGDMRTVRLRREFDAVFVHDAICYMTTPDDLLDAIETAFVHCRPPGHWASPLRHADADHGHRRDRPTAGHQSATSGASGLSVPAAAPSDPRPNEVWAMDITYIPMPRGFVYLAVVMDWASRRVLSWRLSITLDSAFCIAAVEEAIARYGRPEIFNTDQGAQFTSAAFTGLLRDHGIRISMDGLGCWRDNIFVERFWRTLKYEEVYFHAYDSVSDARASIGSYLTLLQHPSPTFQPR